MSENWRCSSKGTEWSPSIARRPQRTALFSDFRRGRLDTNSIFRSPFCRMVTPKKRRTVAAVNCVPNHSYLYDTSFLFTGSRIFSIISSRRFLSLVGLRG